MHRDVQRRERTGRVRSAKRGSCNLESAKRESCNLESAKRESCNLESAKRESCSLGSAKRESCNLQEMADARACSARPIAPRMSAVSRTL
jgi:uncharacterized protein YjbI with pentapeptide repeats